MNRSFESKFWNGDTVYQRVSKEESPGIVTCVQIAANGGVMYGISWDGGGSFCYECELAGTFEGEPIVEGFSA